MNRPLARALLAASALACGMAAAAEPTSRIVPADACFEGGYWPFIATPRLNTIIRVNEVEVDPWGLNLARAPLAKAEVLHTLVEYRQPDPGPIEAFVFFDHPSARTRTFNAMQWRAQLAGSNGR